MGHINAGLEWLVQAFNDMWPLIVAVFIGAWLAFQYLRRYEKRREIDARDKLLKSTLFVISSQFDRLKRLYGNALEPYKDNNRRAEIIPPLQIHDDYPRLEMKALPSAFVFDDYELMNEVVDTEQRFLDVVDLLKRRARQLHDLDDSMGKADGSGVKESLQHAVRMSTDKLFDEVDTLLDMYQQNIKRLREYIEQQPNLLHGDLVDHLAWIILASTCAVVGVFFFSHWAINADAVMSLGLDISLVSALVFAVSLYLSLALCAVLAVMGVYALVKKMRSYALYFWSLLISVQPTVFLLWMDAS